MFNYNEFSKDEDEQFSDYDNADQDQLNCCLAIMCMRENLPHIQYLLTSPMLKIHADFYADDNEAFKCLEDCDLKIMKYLIFDYGIKINRDIKEILDTFDNEFSQEIKKMFKLKDYQNLNEELSNSKNQVKRSKI